MLIPMFINSFLLLLFQLTTEVAVPHVFPVSAAIEVKLHNIAIFSDETFQVTNGPLSSIKLEESKRIRIKI